MTIKCFLLLCMVVLLCFYRCQKLTEIPKGELTPVNQSGILNSIKATALHSAVMVWTLSL
jgi:hypothetical protein